MAGNGQSLNELAGWEYAHRFPWYDEKRWEYLDGSITELLHSLEEEQPDDQAEVYIVEQEKVEPADANLTEETKQLMEFGVCDKIEGEDERGEANQKNLLVWRDHLNWVCRSFLGGEDISAGFPVAPGSEEMRRQLSYFGAASRLDRLSKEDDLDRLRESVIETRLQAYLSNKIESFSGIRLNVRKFGRRTTKDKESKRPNRRYFKRQEDSSSGDSDRSNSIVDLLNTLGHPSTVAIEKIIANQKLIERLDDRCDRLGDLPQVYSTDDAPMEVALLEDINSGEKNIMSLRDAYDIVEDTKLERASDTVLNLDFESISALNSYLRNQIEERDGIEDLTPGIVRRGLLEFESHQVPKTVEIEARLDTLQNEIGIERDILSNLVGDLLLTNPLCDDLEEYIVLLDVDLANEGSLDVLGQKHSVMQETVKFLEKTYIEPLQSLQGNGLSSWSLAQASRPGKKPLPRSYKGRSDTESGFRYAWLLQYRNDTEDSLDE